MTEVATPKMSIDSRELALAVSAACLERKAEDVVVLEVSGTVSYTDYLVICSGRSDRQVRAISEGVGRAMRDLPDPRRPHGVEGERAANWILMDFDDVVLHVFQRDARVFYDLERLWFDAPRVEPETEEAPSEAADTAPAV